MPFNGFGTTPDGGAPSNDSLTSAARNYRNEFFWVSHTYDHENLDCFDPVPDSGICTPATYAQSVAEIDQNVAVGNSLRLVQDLPSMVTPNVSGVGNGSTARNPEFLRAAWDKGIRYLVMDATQPPSNGVRPNTGVLLATLGGDILGIPRRATNIFYNVKTGFTGTTGSEPDEYNWFYATPGGPFPPVYSRPQTYSEIAGYESDIMVRNLLRYEAYPSMFHQANLWRYNGTNSLFSDVMDAVISEFRRLCSLQVRSLSQTQIGSLVSDRMFYNDSGVTATLTPGVSITLTVTNAATIPITGVCSTGCENYGGQSQSKVPVSPGSPVTIPLT